MATSDLMLALLSLDAYNRGSYSELQWGASVQRPGLGAPDFIGDAECMNERDRETWDEVEGKIGDGEIEKLGTKIGDSYH